MGAKSVYLAEMRHALDLPVPPFLVISSDAVWHFLTQSRFPTGFLRELREALGDIDAEAGQKIGQGLSLSVRAAGPRFMSGILFSILNVGRAGKNCYTELKDAIERVAFSWRSSCSTDYRTVQGYTDYPCHAIILQKMVFGDRDVLSATGIYHTLSPTTGEEESGRIIRQAQGPALMTDSCRTINFPDYLDHHPLQAGEVRRAGLILQTHFRDAQEIEFTVESGCTYFLQSRPPDRSSAAAVRIALKLVEEGLISEARAAELVSLQNEADLTADALDEGSIKPDQLIAFGQGMAPGIGIGPVALTVEVAIANPGSILVREAVKPSDFMAIRSSKGIISFKDEVGAHTRSLALAGRIPAIANVRGMRVDLTNGRLIVETNRGTRVLTERETISINGHVNRGDIYRGEVGFKKSEVAELLDRFRRRMNIDDWGWETPDPHKAEILARGIIKVRNWRKLPREIDRNPEVIDWAEVWQRAQGIPEVRDFPRSVLITAFDLLRRKVSDFDSICDAILRQERTEPGLWGYDPFETYEHIVLGENALKLCLALYHLDKAPVKRISLALANVRLVRHGDVLGLLVTLPPDSAVPLLDSMVEAVYNLELGVNAGEYFTVFAIYALSQSPKHQEILNHLHPKTLAFFLEGYWSLKVAGGSCRSTTVKTGLPEIKNIAEVIEKLSLIERSHLIEAVSLIKDEQARIFWERELLKIR